MGSAGLPRCAHFEMSRKNPGARWRRGRGNLICINDTLSERGVALASRILAMRFAADIKA
jgi:hypothetical protein